MKLVICIFNFIKSIQQSFFYGIFLSYHIKCFIECKSIFKSISDMYSTKALSSSSVTKNHSIIKKINNFFYGKFFHISLLNI
nr:MAG TPA: hypothetical protein [Caudoviricetes sp.]